MAREVFGAYLKKLRLERDFGLRDFAKRIGMDVGNLSRIERSKVNPPRGAEQLRRIAEVLGLKEGTSEWGRLFDLSREDQPDRLAADVAEYAAEHRFVPLLMRTVANKKLEDKELLDLARKIEENY
jgi:transcriptional regulator with XRE-family HTH domain